MNRAALYIRVSTERQAEEGFSLEAQRDILLDVMDKKGLTLYKVYSDPGVSGGSFKRPGIQAMLSDMKAKKFDTILIHKLDRLSRNQGDLYSFIELINKLDVRLIIAAQGSEEIDTRSPMGKAFLSFSGIWAEMYLDNLREETLKGLTKKIQKGGKHISRPPLGYTFDSDYNLIVVEEEAKLVREVYELYITKGWGVTKIAKHMNDFSTTKEGGKWDNKNVRNLITNPTYAGFHHFKPDHWTEDKRIITQGSHTPLIPLEWFEKVKKMRERRAEGHMSRRSFEYPYGGLVKCGICGATYTGNSSTHSGKTYRSYRCLNQYAKNTCDAPGISERQLNDLVFEHVLIKDEGIQDAKNDKQQKKAKRDLQKEVEISNRRRKNWMMALGDGNLSSEDYAALIEEEDSRMRDLYKELQAEEQEEEPEISAEDLRVMVLTLKDNWDLLEAGTQKELIQSMFKKIVIKKEEDGWQLLQLVTV